MVAGVFVYPHLFSPQKTNVFRSTYFGLTHDFPLPLGRCTSRSRYVTPMGGVVPSHRPLSVERENSESPT
jgi:hypothetical protein